MPPRPLAHVQVTLVYGERNLHKTLSMPKGLPIHEAKEMGEVELSAHLSTLSGFPKIKFDPECTDVYPKPNPASEEPTLGELNGDVTMVLWPQEDPSTHFTTSPVTDTLARTGSELLELRSKKAAAALIAEESATPKSRKRGKQTEEKEATAPIPSGDISEQIASMRIQMNELEKDLKAENKDLKADNQRLDGLVRDLEADNQRLNVRVSNMHQGIEEIRRFAVLIAPIHIRVLLDRSRGKIVRQSPYASWEDLRDSCGMYELKRTIASTHSIPDALASFICEFTNVRRDGNEAAHTAECRDIRSAVRQKPEGAERRLLEQLYQFVFNEDINSRDLNE